ncbi:GIY-YIG nuclease family protein [Roseivirga misakiensis]|uniref:Excinuclease ABC subunit C n=1 Tax=Roseivirga misakiensis TaxID=1563681 RepID=A0A1E5T0U0_9BACT|nr:GIY-YIG nuclease family protein [Roseivirga misakiensis]OEK04976.1 excinuclease ABC subunit C [Roseivirga misakiensis]
MVKGGTVYILTNKNKTTLYVGVTSDIRSRLREHLEKKYPRSFTSRYNLFLLIYMEHFSTIEEAIFREKYIKGKRRNWKENLIKSENPNWKDLGPEVLSW